MKLDEYRTQHPFALATLAKAARITVSAVSDIVQGRRQPSLDVAIAIEKFTEGKVTCKDLHIPKSSKKKPSARAAA